MPKNTMAKSYQNSSQHTNKRKIANPKEITGKNKEMPSTAESMTKTVRPKTSQDVATTIGEPIKSGPVTNKRKPRPPQLQPPVSQNKRIKLAPSAAEKQQQQQQTIVNTSKLPKTVIIERPTTTAEPPKVHVTLPQSQLPKVMVNSGSSSITNSMTSNASSTKSRPTSRTEARSTDVLLKLTDQYRMEIVDLKQALASEKAAVRTLRSQNDADIRKMKSESRRHQAVVNQQSIQNLQEQISSSDSRYLVEIKKLRLENTVLKDHNKQLEERNQMRKGKQLDEKKKVGTQLKIGNRTTTAHGDDRDVMDLQGSDYDSAVSSAPPSLSPQPGIFTNSQDEWQLFAKESKELESMRNDIDAVHKENQLLTMELATARQQIGDLEKTLFESLASSKIDERLQRIAYLEKQLQILLEESYELREQNELLEFRNIELEESYKYKSQQLPEPNESANNTAQSVPAKPYERMVATVQPYSTIIINTTTTTIGDDFVGTNQPLTNNDSSSNKPTQMLDTSFINHQNVCSQCTQTESIDFSTASTEQNNGDLCAEIQKLNKFRKKIEGTNKSGTVSSILTSPNASEERRLQYYKERLELLENKIVVYESSGDAQTRRLAERLQREVQLESSVKQLNERVAKMTQENMTLREERCEFEEAENDTRLQLQRLQMDMEIRQQRDQEMEALRDVTDTHATCLTDAIAKAQERISILEEHQKDVQTKLELLTTFMPTSVMLNSCPSQQPQQQQQQQPKPVILGIHRCVSQSIPAMCMCIQNHAMSGTEQPQYERLCELMDNEKELKQSIGEINRTYADLLENADYLWPQMERDYKEKIQLAESEAAALHIKIGKLEERQRQDTFCSLERITLLEESESTLQMTVAEVTRERKQWSDKCQALSQQLDTIAEKYAKLQQYLAGPATDNLKIERQKVRELEKELHMASTSLAELQKAYVNQLNAVQKQLQQTEKELTHIAVSNGELKEEVATLEHRCLELYKLRQTDEETIKNMSDELRFKYDQLNRLNVTLRKDGEPLAEEMGYVLRSSVDKTIA